MTINLDLIDGESATEAIQIVSEIAEANEIEWALVGGVAMAIYGSDRTTKDIDIIAIKFKCCGDWFPCFECHKENTDHQAKVWAIEEFETKAVLCGNCGYKMSIAEYMKCDSVCLKCGGLFNPGCANHYYLYFETKSSLQ